MLKNILKSELKNMFRDPLYIFFIFYPVILGIVGYFLVPYIESEVPAQNPAPEIVSMFLILITSYIFGAVTAFTLLDDKDDNVLLSLKITPVNVRYYVLLKLAISYIFALLATAILILATGFLSGSSLIAILAITFVGALQAPGVALIVNSFSDNKVEGFVVMKLSGLVLIIPVMAFFIQTWQEVFLVFAPGFWPARLVQMELLPTIDVNFTFIWYFILGVFYNLVFIYLFMKLYTKRSNI